MEIWPGHLRFRYTHSTIANDCRETMLPGQCSPKKCASRSSTCCLRTGLRAQRDVDGGADQLGGTQADCERRSPVDVACCLLPEVEGDHSDAEGDRRTAPTGGIHRAGVLADLTFHNVSTINKVLGVMFGDHMKGLNLAEVGRLNTGFHCCQLHSVGRAAEAFDEFSETEC